MPKQNKKRLRNLIAIFSLTAVVLSVSTYAWFIGMRTVNVSSFDVEIASTDSLLLSLNGSTWDTTVAISQSTVNDTAVVYEGNTNSWGGAGLFPVSSVGAMDNTASRMKLFEKASLTSTPGGYRLMASQVKNYTAGATEQDGYVAFDLFVKNFSGTQYIEALEPLDEEAIYLTNDSAVTVSSTGGVDGTGIENSVRVAFAQIGRVAGTTTTASTITGITCTSVPGSVTGICRTAQIWEPNDTQHVANAISWYNTSCKKRTGDDLTLSGSYSGTCGVLTDGIAYPTYAINNDITSGNKVDIYDGGTYNGYTANGSGTLLTAYPYFTDTMKLFTGTSRPTFMTLSPNSITKVRVYIYIEGQDIDNYDFASIGKKISVKFGFTKERYTEDDINYNGENLNQGDGPSAADTTVPVITLVGNSVVTIPKTAEPDTYADAGATAQDTVNGVVTDLTSSIVKTGTVNSAVPGTYRVLYTVTDASGNVGTKTRTVIITE
jgi:hypothetical protein